LDFREPEFARIVFFSSGARYKSKICDRKHDRVEYGLVSLVKGTIYENMIAWTSHAGATGLPLVGCV
jgi:hypothetical protein